MQEPTQHHLKANHHYLPNMLPNMGCPAGPGPHSENTLSSLEVTKKPASAYQQLCPIVYSAQKLPNLRSAQIVPLASTS